MTRAVLVTGAGGLLAGSVLPLLADQPLRVVAASRRGGDHVACDLTDPAATRRLVEDAAPDVVLHLAGGAGGAARDLYERNVVTTLNVLAAAAAAPAVPSVIVLGSAAEYGEPEGGVATEDTPLRPLGDYGRAKAAQTVLAGIVAERDGVPLTVVRPFNVVAPNLPAATALGQMRRQLRAGTGPQRTVRGGKIDIERDYVPVDFVARVLARLVADPEPGVTMNVCSGVGIRLGAILDEMARVEGVSVRHELDPDIARIPAAQRIVGDPSLLESRLGLSTRPTVESIAALMLGSYPSTSSR